MVMGEQTLKTQVAVIGGGVGGYTAAFRAADLGLEVALINQEERLGGVCLLRGCIPSKTLLEVTQLIHEARKWLMIAEIRLLNDNPDLEPASYYFRKVIDQFPGTPYAARAAQRLRELEEGQQ